MPRDMPRTRTEPTVPGEKCDGGRALAHLNVSTRVQLAALVFPLVAHLAQLATGNERQLSTQEGTAATGGED